MSQCVVPSWDLDDPPNPPTNLAALPHPSTALVPLLPFTTDNYDEVAELTWRNGQLALHGHSPPTAKWSKRRHHTGTLESLVNQATGAATTDLIDWTTGGKAVAVSSRALVSRSAAPDALVPSGDAEVPAATGTGDFARRKRGRGVGVCSSQGSAVPPVPKLRVRNESIVEFRRGVRDDIEITTTTATATATNSNLPDDGSGDGSPDMENSERDENDSVNHKRLQGQRDEKCEEEKGKGKGSMRESQRNSSWNKKSRAAIIHNQSERKRRDRINQKMKALQKLVPNSSKTDKASILDEAINYMKQLQSQVQMMNQMGRMMMPMPMPQMQMSMMSNMAQMAQMAQMGMNMVDIASVNRPAQTTIPPLLHPSSFLSQQTGGLPDPFSAFLAYQNAQQPMTLDAYNRMATLFQQLYQQKPPANP